MVLVWCAVMIVASQDLKRQIADAIGRAVSTRYVGEAVMVSLPILYPSGAFAGVHINVSGDRCFVSDAAIGLREAEMAGVTDFFDNAARAAAKSFGVGYDGASIFAASAPLARVDGAIIAVANASSNAVTHALLSAAESKEKTRNNVLFDLVKEIFGPRNVSRREAIIGREATWDAHNVVVFKGRRSVFEFVNQNTNSIASKFLMFSDISRSETPPALNSVVEAVDELGPKGAMLGDVSNIISLDASRDRFIKLASAA